MDLGPGGDLMVQGQSSGCAHAISAERESRSVSICYGNALAAFGPSGQFQEEDWRTRQPRDERQLYLGNSVLRGQEPRVDELPTIPEHDDGRVVK